MDWMFEIEDWLIAPAIPLWLVLLLMLIWPDFLRRLREFRTAGSEDRSKRGLLLAVETIGLALVFWLMAISVSIST